MTATLEVKIGKLQERMKGGREDQLAEVINMKKVLKTALLKKNLKEHPALGQLLALLRKREQAYSLILQNKKELTESERAGYFDRREELRFILSFFDSADKTISKIEEQLDYQLSDEVEDINSSE